MDRRLAAILSADVQGYSRLMGDDEEATVRTLKLYFQLMTTLIEQHRGRVVDSPGDNLLAEFGSVVDAVQGAMAIQLELNARNHELPPDRRMRFRIGINLGDIVADGERIYGDGVNIAARVEALAEPGGICISATVHEHIKNKLPLGYVSLGEQAVKNINEPVEVYRVLVQGEELPPQPPPSVEPLTHASASPPSPFTRRRVARSAMLAGGLAIGAFVAVILFQTWFPAESTRRTEDQTSHITDTAPAVATRAALRPQSIATVASPAPSASAAIGVMNFKALVPDSESAWMAEAIRDNLNGQLNRVEGLEVFSKEFIDFLAEEGDTNELKVAHELGIERMVSGSFIAKGDQLRIEAHVVNVKTGLLEISDFVEGPQSDFFEMQTELAFIIAGHLDIRVSPEDQAIIASGAGNSSIDNLKLLLEAERDGPAADSLLESEFPRPQREDSLNGSMPDFLLATVEWLERGWLGVGTAWADDSLGAEAEIRGVLERYRQAYENKDLVLLSSIYAELSPKQREASQKYFENTEDLVVEINDVRIAVRGDDAIASYTREDRFKDRKSGELVKLDVRLTKKLHKTGGNWKLVGKK